MDKDSIAFAQMFVDAFGFDLREHSSTAETPKRWISAMRELMEGVNEDPKTNIKVFPSSNDQMVVVRNIEFFSLCEHHLLPFFGTCTVGYIPNGQVIGLSKIPRIVKCFARRPQVQENMTDQIANFLFEELGPKGVGVHTIGQHLCMMSRGIKQVDAIMHTTSLRGNFQNIGTKQEFLSYGRS